MIAASLIGLICGAGLGRRFRVLLLVPAIVLMAAVTLTSVMSGLASGHRAGADLLAWSLGLELAYAATISFAAILRADPR